MQIRRQLVRDRRVELEKRIYVACHFLSQFHCDYNDGIITMGLSPSTVETNNHMELYLGTYDGFLIMLRGEPPCLRVALKQQISENSIRTLCLADGHVVLGGYDQELRAIHPSTGAVEIQSKQSNGIINCVSPIGEGHLAVGLDNGTLRFWDDRNFESQLDIKEHKTGIRDLKVESQGAVLVSVGGKDMVFWSTITRKSIYHYRFDFNIEAVQLSRDFSTIFLFTEQVIREIDAQTNEERHKVEVQSKIQCSLLYGDYLILATSTGEVLIWTVGQYQFKITFQAHSSRIKALQAVTVGDTDYLISASASGEVALWDVLEFLREVDKISQDYVLNGLKPIQLIKVNQRIVAMEGRPYQQKLPVQIKHDLPLKSPNLSKINPSKINLTKNSSNKINSEKHKNRHKKSESNPDAAIQRLGTKKTKIIEKEHSIPAEKKLKHFSRKGKDGLVTATPK